MQICDPVLRYRKSGFLYNGRIFRGKAYGLTEEETEKLAELVKEKVKTQYLDKYEIDPASFTFPEYEPIAERKRQRIYGLRWTGITYAATKWRQLLLWQKKQGIKIKECQIREV